MKKIAKSVFTVKDKTYLTPHYIRVTFHMTEEQAKDFKNVTVGNNNKIFIPPADTKVIYFPDTAKGIDPAYLPIMRTYTTRSIDFTKGELCIDFIAHGDNGPASAWAEQAFPGDVLGIAMKESSRALFPEADEYVLIADATGIPVTATILERLPAAAKASVIVEVHGDADEIEFKSNADVNIQYIHNEHPENGSKLAQIVKQLKLPNNDIKRYAHVVAEYDTVKALRQHFKFENEWAVNEFSASAYWRAGKSENQSAEERREERHSAA